MLYSQTYSVDGYHVERIVGRFSRVRWQCNCPTFQAPPPRWLYPWCRHVMSVMSQQQAPIHIAAGMAEEPDYEQDSAQPLEPKRRPAHSPTEAERPTSFPGVTLVGA